jgi:hypothetical protein
MLSVCSLAMLGVFGGLGGFRAPNAMAEDEPPQPPPISVTLTLVTPDVLVEDTVVTISGTVTNTTAETMSDLRVALWSDSSSITTMRVFRDALEAEPHSTIWEPETDADAAIDNLVAVSGTLPPGESTTFSVSGLVSGEDSLDLEPGGVYAIGVQVWQGDDDWYEPVGEGRVLMAFPEATTSSATALPVVVRPVAVSVVVLNSVPSLVQPSVAGADPVPALFSDDHLAQELGGRLAILLTYASDPNVTLVVDPELYNAVTEMTRGYNVRSLDGPTVAGAGTQQAQTWLAGLDAVLADPAHNIYRGLYGTPDLAWACSNEAPDVLELSTAPTVSSDLLAALPAAAVSSYGRSTSNLIECLAPYGPLTLLVDSLDNSYTLHSNVEPDADGSQDVPAMDLLEIVAVSNDLVSTAGPDVPAWGDDKSDTQMSSALLAMRYVWALDGQPLVTIVDTATQASAARLADQQSQLVHLDDIEAYVEAQFPVIWRSDMSAALFLTEDLPSLTDVAGRRFDEWLMLTNRVQYVADYKKQLITGAWSSGWNGNDADATAWLDAAYAPVLSNLTGSVTISGSRVWHISSEATQLPIQVSNSTKVTMVVHIEFASENEQRFHVPPTEDVEIGPGETVTVRVEPQAEANGTLSVAAWVATGSGQRLPDSLHSNELTFVVSVSSAGRLAWLIIAASGAAFLGLTAWRVYDVRKHGKGDRASRVGLLVRFLRLIGRYPGVDGDPEAPQGAD